MSPSTFTVFARKINGSGWTKRVIRRKFLKQVDTNDYSPADRQEILNFLFSLAKKV